MKLKKITEIETNLIEAFSCGNAELDTYFKKYASDNEKNGYGVTYVLTDENTIFGFVTLCNAQIEFENYPKGLNNRLPRYPIPAVRIARLAVSKNYQGKGYGKTLLKYAFLKIVYVSRIVGTKLVVVDAKESSKLFDEKYGFKRLIDTSLTYFLNIETILKAIKTK